MHADLGGGGPGAGSCFVRFVFATGCLSARVVVHHPWKRNAGVDGSMRPHHQLLLLATGLEQCVVFSDSANRLTVQDVRASPSSPAIVHSVSRPIFAM